MEKETTTEKWGPRDVDISWAVGQFFLFFHLLFHFPTNKKKATGNSNHEESTTTTMAPQGEPGHNNHDRGDENDGK